MKEAIMAKYHYYRVFRQDPVLRRHMPETAICSRKTLADYLNRHRAVYIKPDVGGRGEGVVHAWQTADGTIRYIVEKGQPRTCHSPSALWHQLGLSGKKKHVVQQALRLATYRGSKYDIRLMMIRDARRQWQYCGMLAKTAGPASIVTNIARGKGEVVPADRALGASHGPRGELLKQEMLRLARRCNRLFDRIRYEWQMGYDFAVDEAGKVWLIEANPGNPSHALFAKLPDQTLYRRIKQAVRAYKTVHGNDGTRRGGRTTRSTETLTRKPKIRTRSKDSNMATRIAAPRHK